VIAISAAVVLIFVVRRRYLWHSGLSTELTPGVPEPDNKHR